MTIKELIANWESRNMLATVQDIYLDLVLNWRDWEIEGNGIYITFKRNSEKSCISMISCDREFEELKVELKVEGKRETKNLNYLLTTSDKKKINRWLRSVWKEAIKIADYNFYFEIDQEFYHNFKVDDFFEEESGVNNFFESIERFRCRNFKNSTRLIYMDLVLNWREWDIKLSEKNIILSKTNDIGYVSLNYWFERIGDRKLIDFTARIYKTKYHYGKIINLLSEKDLIAFEKMLRRNLKKYKKHYYNEIIVEKDIELYKQLNHG